jgi:hypothetical protein
MVILLSTRGTAGSDHWFCSWSKGQCCEATIREIKPERLSRPNLAQTNGTIDAMSHCEAKISCDFVLHIGVMPMHRLKVTPPYVWGDWSYLFIQ